MLFRSINFTGATPIDAYHFPGVWDSNYKGLLGYDNYWFVDGYAATEFFTANTPANTINGNQIITGQYTADNTYNSTI